MTEIAVTLMPVRRTIGGVAAFGSFAVITILAPLATYTVTLAVFGLPHVLSELRYVDRRFGRRISRQILLSMGMLLPFIVVTRAGTVFHVIPARLGMPAELGGVALLALACVGGSLRQKALALAVAGTLGGATLSAPFVTAVALSILHNMTPLGFLWQIVPRPRRAGVMALALCAFIGLPLLAATGLPRAALAGLFGALPDFDPFGAGPLAAHLFVYVLPRFVETPAAPDLFTASVVAQGAHYMAVIIILPLLLRRLDPEARGLAVWPRGIWFALLCLGAATLGIAKALDGFADMRALYSIAASLHAWIEIPVLIFALTTGAQRVSQSPHKTDAELAASETSMARSMRSAAIHAMSTPSANMTPASSVMTDGQ